MVDDNILQLDMDENVLFNYDIWEKVSETCLGCGTCTYICPTCHCFGFRDTAVKGEASRYRYWDSCMYPKFTLHASGHNPRPTRKERFRQRVMHKYVYIKKNFGLTACTGCGRCIRSCPAGINIRSVVKSIMQEVSK
ncbi:MAG: 4Fe-4S dicluster domain-containing protein [Acetivibrionales bacterium]